MDKYRVEFMDYKYNWIDVGPGPPKRGREIGLYSIKRNYKKIFTDIVFVLKEVERMQKFRYGSDLIIVSKLQNDKYIPGKLTVPTYGIPTWKALEDFSWKRCDTRLPMFDLFYKKEPAIRSYGLPVVKNTFIKREPTISEIMDNAEKSYGKSMATCILNEMKSKSLINIFRTLKLKEKTCLY